MNKRIISFLLLLPLFVTAVAQTSPEARQLLEKGLNAEQLGLLDLATDYYTQAQAVQPEWAQPDYRLGVIAQRRCHYNQAIAHFQQAISLNDTLADAYARLASCMIDNGNWEPLPTLQG